MDTHAKRYCVKPYCRYELISGLSIGLDVGVDGSERVHVITYPQTLNEGEGGCINLSDLANSHATAVFMALSVLHPEAEVAVDYLDGHIEERQPSMLFDDLELD
jgi:hypothetical protein